MSDQKEISAKIRSQAAELLSTKKIPSLLSEWGQLYFTGSYSLELMTWNDIDMQLRLKEGFSPSDSLVNILGKFVADPDFVVGKIIHFSGDYKPQWPRGYCLCLKFNMPSLGGLWKLDLWVLSQEEIAHNQAFMEKLKGALTDLNRQLILDMKFELMQPTGRVPKKGSFWLYHAVLLQGLTEKRAILDYLISKNVPL